MGCSDPNYRNLKWRPRGSRAIRGRGKEGKGGAFSNGLKAKSMIKKTYEKKKWNI